MSSYLKKLVGEMKFTQDNLLHRMNILMAFPVVITFIGVGLGYYLMKTGEDLE